MIKLKIDLIPKNNSPLPIIYNSYLDDLCNNIINDKKKDFTNRRKKHINLNDEKQRYLLTYSKLYCSKYEIDNSYIKFKDKVTWYITSPIYELILHFVQKLFNSHSLKIGESEFKVVGLTISKETILYEKNNFNIINLNHLDVLNNFNTDIEELTM
ncbi:MAG: hypothetical protein ACERKV_03140 [Clostridiaceae bacterium]